MPEFDLSTWEGAIQALAMMRIEPYMNATPEVVGRVVLFRRIAGAGSKFASVDNTRQLWPQLISTLDLTSEEKVARVRRTVRSRIPKKPR